MRAPIIQTLALLASIPVQALAQTHDVQDPLIDGRRLRPFDISGMVYGVQGKDTVPTGSYASQLTVYQDRIVFVTAGSTRLFGQTLDTIIDRLPDLQPIAYYERSRAGISRVDFEGAQATGSYTKPDGTSTPITFTRSLDARDQPSLVLLLAAADLRDGLTFTWRLFNPVVDSSTVALEATVVGHEPVKGSSCWKVRIAVDSSGQKVPFGTIWLDDVTHVPRRDEIQLTPNVSLLSESSRVLSRDSSAP